MFYDYYPRVEDKLVVGSTMMFFIVLLRKTYELLILYYSVILESRITLLIGYYYYPQLEDKAVLGTTQSKSHYSIFLRP
jgi:hypothetical protein